MARLPDAPLMSVSTLNDIPLPLMTTSPAKILLLDDNTPGHVAQARGLAQSLVREIGAEVVEVSLSVRVKPLRAVMRLLANLGFLGMPAVLLKIFCRLGGLPSHTDLVISSGGNTLFACSALGRVLKARSWISGSVKGYRASCFDKVFSVVPLGDGVPNNQVLPLPPTPLVFNEVEPEAGINCVLIGGNGAGCRYEDEDWQQLANLINNIGAEEGRRWLLTTSRRTGKTGELILKRLIKDEYLLDAVWFDTAPRKVVGEFLQRSEQVYCTEDSIAMISESIYSGRPVVTLRPEFARFDANDQRILDKYSEQQLILRRSLTDTPPFDLSGLRQLSGHDVDELVAAAYAG